MSKELFDLAYRQSDLVYNGWWEQAALMRVLRYEDPRSHEKHWSEFSLKELPITITDLDSTWNSTIEEFACDPIIRHFAGDPLPLKLLLMAEYILARASSVLSPELTESEKLIGRGHYLTVRNEIFESRVTLQDKVLRLIRRVWSKITDTPGYKYK